MVTSPRRQPSIIRRKIEVVVIIESRNVNLINGSFTFHFPSGNHILLTTIYTTDLSYRTFSFSCNRLGLPISKARDDNQDIAETQ